MSLGAGIYVEIIDSRVCLYRHGHRDTRMVLDNDGWCFLRSYVEAFSAQLRDYYTVAPLPPVPTRVRPWMWSAFYLVVTYGASWGVLLALGGTAKMPWTALHITFGFLAAVIGVLAYYTAPRYGTDLGRRGRNS